ncbi:uncharacterized protein BDW70DRAFT_15468 [Aspergillus foveolatus]|uniref:uncharacterized protein n=1 Tax=Aspergillus foveolatus TaxID=210207 RepID=UPI003CCCC116
MRYGDDRRSGRVRLRMRNDVTCSSSPVSSISARCNLVRGFGRLPKQQTILLGRKRKRPGFRRPACCIGNWVGYLFIILRGWLVDCLAGIHVLRLVELGFDEANTARYDVCGRIMECARDSRG